MSRSPDSMYSSSSCARAAVEEWRRCGCGSWTPLLTAWTRDNAGRRFWSCPNYQVRDCGYFEWKDDRFCDQAQLALKVLMNEKKLLKEKLEQSAKSTEDKEAKLREKEEKLKLKESKIKEKVKKVLERESLIQHWFYGNVVFTLIVFLVLLNKF